MEGDSLYGERISIRDKVRSLKKYGSTCNHVRNTSHDALVRHDVDSTDTLQGIALKYGCTTEQIRRQNRLYASDSLFVKPYLMIPVAKGSPHYPPETTTTSPNAVPDSHRWPHSTLFPEDQSYTGPWDPLQGGPQPGPSHSMDLPSTSSSSASPSSTPTPVNAPPAECLSPEEEQKKDLDELLGKIDSTIASSRRFVAKSQDSSDFAVVSEENEDHLDGHYYDGAYQNASSTTHMRNLSSGSGNFHTADDTSNLITNTRQVKSTMRRLEQTQDELFEL